jgi:hypothetical protein
MNYKGYDRLGLSGLCEVRAHQDDDFEEYRLLGSDDMFRRSIVHSSSGWKVSRESNKQSRAADCCFFSSLPTLKKEAVVPMKLMGKRTVSRLGDMFDG